MDAVMSRVARWAAAAFVAFALVIVLYEPDRRGTKSAFDRFAQGFAQNGPRASIPQSPALQPGQVPVAAIPHTTAPDPRVLASDPARQAAYDAGAQPGEFVTPPTVSIEH
jgi:hypothetical protein